MPSSEATSVAQPAQLFATTQWSAVNLAGQDSSPEAKLALERLCATYWYPLYAYVRRKGHSVDEAQDLTQEFFAYFLERKYFQRADRNRGRFRTFLLTSLGHFLINEWTKANREKRGGGQKIISLDEETAESRFLAGPAEQPSETVYDRGWAGVLLDRAWTALSTEQAQAGKQELFDRLKIYVWGEKNSLSYREMAEQLGMSEEAVKTSVHRLRKRYGELLRLEVAQTVLTAGDVEDELRYLISVIRNETVVSGNISGKEL